MISKNMKKTRRARTKNHYFTKVHENAIIKYCETEDRDLREKLYGELIQPAFNQMVDKIIYTYRFTSLPNIRSLSDDCKVWLTTILNKYDPNKGSKAFSYFSVVTKNWFIHKVKRNQKRNRTEVYLEDMINELEEECISDEPTYLDKREDIEFWLSLYKEIDTWDGIMLKENERKVLMAVRILMDSADSIEIFNKKAIYLYLREITGLNSTTGRLGKNGKAAKYNPRRLYRRNDYQYS